MGGSDSKPQEYSQDGLKRFHQNFQYIRSEFDPRISSEVKIYKEKSTGKLIGLINKVTENGDSLDKLKIEIQHRKALDHINFARIIGYTKAEEDTLCGTGHNMTLYNEWFDHDLDLEITERSSRKVFLNQIGIFHRA